MTCVPGRQLKATHTADIPWPRHSLASLDVVVAIAMVTPSGYYQKASCVMSLPV